MLRCMYSGISGMKVNQTKLDIIGNNIANVGTTAFKASSAKFSDMLYQNAGTATSATSTKGGTNAKQVGLGAKLSSIDKLMSQGNALTTGRSLDTCIDGEGYIVVGTGILDYKDGGTTLDTAQGISGGDMSISYTRDGNFKLDSDGNLLTSDGYRVMGYLLTATNADATGTETVPASAAKSLNDKGEAQYVDADGRLKAASDTTLQPLRIPDSVYVPTYKDGDKDIPASNQKVASFSIGKDGVITAVLANGSRTALGQIATATFKNPEGLTSMGGNLYQTSSNSGAEIIRTAINVGITKEGTAITGDTARQDNSKAFGDLIQGALEASNVDLTEQFTEMITATRSFQASSKMITTGDEILQTVTGLMR